MSKLALVLALPALAVAGGVAVWNVSLSSEIAELRSELDRRPAANEAADTADAGSKALQSRPRGADRMVTELVRRVDALESVKQPVIRERAGSAPAGLAASGGAAPTDAVVELALEDLPLAYRTPEFHTAVVAVLEARDAERRAERREKEAQRLTERMLTGIEVTDDQRADVGRLTLDYLARRDEIRRDDTIEDVQQRERLAALDVERKNALTGVLGQVAADQIQARIDRRGGQRGGQRGEMGRRGQPATGEAPTRQRKGRTRPDGAGEKGNDSQ